MKKVLLATGALVLGVAALFALRRTVGPGGGDVKPPAGPSVRIPDASPPSLTMDGFFGASPGPASAPDPKRLLGTWEARLVSMELPSAEGTECVDVAGAPPFSFAVEAKGTPSACAPWSPGSPPGPCARRAAA